MVSVRLVAKFVLGAAVALVPTLAHAAVTPVVTYNFPASWDGTTTAVTDVSGAGNNGIISTTAGKKPVISTSVLPPGAAAGTDSALTSAGGFRTNGTSLLTNPLIAAAGGFSMSTVFMWNGTDLTTNQHVEKLVDYAGTEALQVDTTTTAAAPGTAVLKFIFTTQGIAPAPDVSVGPTAVIQANVWYSATALFNTYGSAQDVNGSLAGLAFLSVAPVGGAAVNSVLPVTKTTYGDGVVLGARPIGIGELGFPSATSALVPFQGNIYSGSVSLGLVPEPASLSLLGLAATSLLARKRRA